MGADRHFRILRLAAILLTAVLASACASMPYSHPEAYKPMELPKIPPPQRNGAIYQAGYSVGIFEDPKARRVGDLLTIVLAENTQASKSASTTAKKTDTVDIANPTILGSPVQFAAPGLLPLLTNRNNNLANSLSSSNNFAGAGDTSQSNSLTGNITVMVTHVMSNGNLVVEGDKHLTLNQGDEVIHIQGIVRPVDVQDDNTVLSTRVGDAVITYRGKGVVADASKMGWLSRFFISVFWPF
ncbi:MAG: flagellar basal body L-ring protein [Chromatiales bacterium 21-64-14]|nr:MAG: flagellar basal body L-ring protein [Chromatiales bacterium 21-64-14]HQU15102.1 flagellar basal body L-ring protein FlgH [Gammaproteobacteria bacterium]